MNLNIEFLYFRGCPYHEIARQALREVLRENGLKIALHNMRIDSHDEAIAKRFLGSPTIRINDVDIEPGAESRSNFGMQCRVYLDNSLFTGMPSKSMIQAALQRALADQPVATVNLNQATRPQEFSPTVCC